MRKLLVAPLLAVLVACSSVPTKAPEGSWTCIHRLAKDRDFTYNTSDATIWYAEAYNTYVYQIHTVDGKDIALNDAEMENYSCQTN